MEITKTLTLSPLQVQETVHRLCHFAPGDYGPEVRESMYDHLVLQALLRLDDSPHSVDEIRDTLKSTFSLSFESVEIADSLQRLRQKKLAIRSAGEPFLYSIPTKRRGELNVIVNERAKLEEDVLQEWLREVERSHPKITKAEKQVLLDDFRLYLSYVFAKHGAECMTLLYPGQKELDSFMDAAIEKGHQLPKREKRIHEMRMAAFSDFFEKASESEIRKRYIAELFDSAFFLFIIHVDPNCSALMRVATEGKKLFLDANVVYRLINLQTPRLYKTTKRVIEVSQALGFATVVSKRTFEELRSSIRGDVKYLEQNPPLSRDFARLAHQYSDESGFITTFWRQHAETGIGLEDFAGTYRNLDTLLAQHGVEITEEFADKIEKDRRHLQYEVDELEYYLNVENGQNRHWELIHHDAFLRLVVLEVRGQMCETFLETNAWLLTCDGWLLGYERKKRDEQGGLPACIHIRNWLQCIRPLLPRTEKYDDVFAELLTSPLIRAYEKTPHELVHKLLATLSYYKDMAPELAATLLADKIFVSRFRNATTQEEREQVIDSALISQHAELEQRRAQEAFRRVKAEQALATEKAAKEKEARARHETEQARAEAEQAKAVAIQESEAERRERLKAERELQKVTSKIEEMSRQVTYLRWGLAVILAMSVFIVVPVVRNWEVIPEAYVLYAEFLTAFIIGLIAACVALGVERTWRRFLEIDAIGGGVVVLWVIFKFIFGG